MKAYQRIPVMGVLFLAGGALLAIGGPVVWAHCQIPCGIYDDGARFVSLKEHITTIEKSMTEINKLSSADPAANVNQLVRWVMNKEDHADQFAEIVTKYFLQQRVKAADPSDKAAYEKYVKQLTLCHEMLVTSMKAKQTTDVANTRKLSELVDAFMESYFSPEDLAHFKEHFSK